MRKVVNHAQTLIQSLHDRICNLESAITVNRTGIKFTRHLKYIYFLSWLIFLQIDFCSAQNNVIIHFVHQANGKKLISDDTAYTNTFNERYYVTKLKYYISNISWASPLKTVSLVNAFATDSIGIRVRAGTYTTLKFLIGVDSVTNTRGAQSGALDPLNDMYWTWNSGFVTWKLEGRSDSSKADLNRIEQHIGGYKAPFASMRYIQLKLTRPLLIKSKGRQHVNVICNLDNYWNGTFDNSISGHAVVVTAGPLASAVADNFAAMFSIQQIPLKP